MSDPGLVLLALLVWAFGGFGRRVPGHAAARRLHPLCGMGRVLDMGWTQRELAARIGKSQAYVSRRLLVLTLPKRVQGAIAAKKISVDQALGYDSGGPRDIFEADEQLSNAWRALRQEVLDTHDRLLIGLLRDFAKAYQARQRAYQARQRVATQPVSAADPEDLAS